MIERSLADWLAYLERLHPVAIDMGLERSREVARRMGLGRPASRVVTVTGTNGKGSTCAFLAALIGAQGLRVGVYSSPHLLRYNERVRIDGREVDDAALCEAFAVVEAARGEISLTYFEMGTLAAFWLFERAGLDAVVLEVGLGGRLDAVNLVDADVAVVTSIALDHAEWLGNTRDSVAFEKAGIFRAGRPVVCGEPDPPAPLLDQAALLGVPLYRRGPDYELIFGEDTWGWRGCNATGDRLELEGLSPLDLPVESAALALQIYALLDLSWEVGSIVQALSATHLSGRLERRQMCWQGKNLSFLLDVGHNPHAATYLARRLAARPPEGQRLAVFGLLADKDLSGVLEPLLSQVRCWAVAPLPTPRSLPAEGLAVALRGRGALVVACADVAEALQVQCRRAAEGDEILVFGSFYCVAEALDWLRRQEEKRDGLAG
ncbi:bifunctional tetrahydrofolate synthase/dihydrofolate synthase [Azotobacter salinestris]|uniref:bifunctional tetrahydrofolate synthase/dihydrofolate synthase n=1 Tax=Azotobacter salinestris TaxID=69964 RepID=UPI0032DFD3BF